MNNPQLIFMLMIGFVLMCGLISTQMRWYSVKPWNSVVIAIALLFTGLIGSRIWYFVENGTFLGRSFYGAIFIAPAVFWPVAKLLKIPYGKAMDFVAPAGCVTLALVKIQCFRDGCCEGIALYLDENHNYVLFPSQLVEMAAFLLIAVVLLFIGSKARNHSKVFLWFLVLYGGTRFILDFFRQRAKPYALGLSAGSFWSLIAFVIGMTVLVIGWIAKKRKEY